MDLNDKRCEYFDYLRLKQEVGSDLHFHKCAKDVYESDIKRNKKRLARRGTLPYILLGVIGALAVGIGSVWFTGLMLAIKAIITGVAGVALLSTATGLAAFLHKHDTKVAGLEKEIAETSRKLEDNEAIIKADEEKLEEYNERMNQLFVKKETKEVSDKEHGEIDAKDNQTITEDETEKG